MSPSRKEVSTILYCRLVKRVPFTHFDPKFDRGPAGFLSSCHRTEPLYRNRIIIFVHGSRRKRIHKSWLIQIRSRESELNFVFIKINNSKGKLCPAHRENKIPSPVKLNTRAAFKNMCRELCRKFNIKFFERIFYLSVGERFCFVVFFPCDRNPRGLFGCVSVH